ncbi:MAG: hypothetical protein IJW81_04670 [Clostridia bacterium]|nr:hypothetical protein [Clostridia bacterium]
MYDDKVAMAENWKKGIHFDVPLLRGVSGEMAKDAYNARDDLLRTLARQEFDSIRNTDRFRNILTKADSLPDITV